MLGPMILCAPETCWVVHAATHEPSGITCDGQQVPTKTTEGGTCMRLVFLWAP